jgi:hypothetical protein
VSPNAEEVPGGKASIDTKSVEKSDNPYVDDGE